MPDSAATPPALPAAVLAAFPAGELLAATFATSISALALLLPVRAAGGDVTDFTFALLSPAAQQLLRQPAHPTATHAQVLPGMAIAGIFALYCEVLATGEPRQHSFNYQLGGFDAYYRLAVARVGAGLLVSFTDTADEPRTPVEVALRESQAREHAARAQAEAQGTQLQALLEQVPVALAVFEGPEQRIVMANEQMAALWGQPLAGVLGRPLLEALPELRGQGFDALVAQVQATQVPVTGTETPATMWRDGQLHTSYYNFVYQPLYDEHGAVRGVLDVAVDVTEQVLARRQVEAKEQQANFLNEELAATNAELQAANEEIMANNDALFRAQQAVHELNTELEARVADRTRELLHARAEAERQRANLYEVFEQTPASVAILRGPAFVVELANPGMCALWGHSLAQVLNKPVFEGMPELRGQGFDRLLAGVMATGQPHVAHEQAAQLPRHGQPETVHFNFVYQPLRDSQGHITGIAVVATDVSEQVAARQQLAQANAELLAANQAVSARHDELASTNQRLLRTNQDLDNFVYAASHDLKQPVNNLMGLFDELRLSTVFTDPEEQELLVPLVDEALAQLSTTINDLAAVGQVQRLPTEPAETVDLAELTQEVLQTLQPQAQAARARVTTDFAARPAISYARASLRTILLNLLSNSFKYADAARPCRVHLSLWLEAGQPVLLVEDNGLGFDMHRHQDELFHLFRRFHTHTEGTGVGLYLINRIVQGNGGHIEVESEVGQGTSFRLYL